MATTCEINNKTPQIQYPSMWQYRIIVEKNIDINGVAQDILKGKEHKLSLSNESKKGKYLSYNLQTLVANEDERKALFDLFKTHKMTKFVL